MLIDALPDSIRVGPYDWKIEKWSPQKAEHEKAWGDCGLGDLTIGIQRHMPSDKFAATVFIHEVSHAIWRSYDIDQNASEEKIVTISGHAWVQIYRDNPWLLGWIADCVGGTKRDLQ